jgi:hypothetical protein
VLLAVWRVVRVVLEEPCPAASDSYHLVPRGVHAIHERLDAGVETRDVAAAGEDRELHALTLNRCRRWGSNPHVRKDMGS